MELTAQQQLRYSCIDLAIRVVNPENAEDGIFPIAERMYAFIIGDEALEQKAKLDRNISFLDYFSAITINGSDGKPIKLHPEPHIETVVAALEAHRHVAVMRARQAGMTLLTTIRCLWEAQRGVRCAIVTTHDSMAGYQHQQINQIYRKFPIVDQTTAQRRSMSFDGGGSIDIATIGDNRLVGRQFDFVVISDAAFDQKWVTELAPLIGSSRILLESAAGDGDSAFDRLFEAGEDESPFVKIVLPWWKIDHLSRRRMREVRAALGEEGFLKEWCCNITTGPSLERRQY